MLETILSCNSFNRSVRFSLFIFQETLLSWASELSSNASSDGSVFDRSEPTTLQSWSLFTSFSLSLFKHCTTLGREYIRQVAILSTRAFINAFNWNIWSTLLIVIVFKVPWLVMAMIASFRKWRNAFMVPVFAIWKLRTNAIAIAFSILCYIAFFIGMFSMFLSSLMIIEYISFLDGQKEWIFMDSTYSSFGRTGAGHSWMNGLATRMGCAERCWAEMYDLGCCDNWRKFFGLLVLE